MRTAKIRRASMRSTVSSTCPGSRSSTREPRRGATNRPVAPDPSPARMASRCTRRSTSSMARAGSPGETTASSPTCSSRKSCMMPRGSNGAAWLGFALRLAAAGVWLASGASKIPDIRTFQVLVQRYGILPNILAGPFAYILPFFELAIGLYLASGLFVRGTALVGTLLFAVFLAAQVSAWARGINLDCGCFGSLVQTTVGPLTILRDFSLGIPTFLMLAFPARTLSLDHRLFGARNMFGS